MGVPLTNAKPATRVGLSMAPLRFGAPLRSALLPLVAPFQSLTQSGNPFKNPSKLKNFAYPTSRRHAKSLI
ncbi:hypothetical protein [Chryseobacterium koreense]